MGRENGRAAGRAYQCDVAADRVRAVVKTLQSGASADAAPPAPSSVMVSWSACGVRASVIST
jgi:hypothetical protein